jgi:hypothetical protein
MYVVSKCQPKNFARLEIPTVKGSANESVLLLGIYTGNNLDYSCIQEREPGTISTGNGTIL